jgi:hypothetical protein
MQISGRQFTKNTEYFPIFFLFESEAQSSILSGTVFLFFFGQKLTILQPLKQTPLFGPFLGSFSGTAKRGWHQMPPNLKHIISKKLPSFWYITYPEAICGCRKKLPVFFFGTPCTSPTRLNQRRPEVTANSKYTVPFY